jgi:hypothetical protein
MKALELYKLETGKNLISVNDDYIKWLESKVEQQPSPQSVGIAEELSKVLAEEYQNVEEDPDSRNWKEDVAKHLYPFILKALSTKAGEFTEGDMIEFAKKYAFDSRSMQPEKMLEEYKSEKGKL